MLERIALFPGSFDPITNGHIEIVERSLKLFDRLVIGIGKNSNKQSFFSIDQRFDWVKRCFESEKRVDCIYFEKLTVAVAEELNIQFIIRGLRRGLDFEFEQTIDHLNKHLNPKIETIYFISSPYTAHISSTMVREIIRFKGDLKGIMPALVVEDIVKLQY